MFGKPSLKKIRELIAYFPYGCPEGASDCVFFRMGRTDKEVLDDAKPRNRRKFIYKFDAQEGLKIFINFKWHSAATLVYYYLTGKWVNKIGYKKQKFDLRFHNLYEMQ